MNALIREDNGISKIKIGIPQTYSLSKIKITPFDLAHQHSSSQSSRLFQISWITGTDPHTPHLIQLTCRVYLSPIIFNTNYTY